MSQNAEAPDLAAGDLDGAVAQPAAEEDPAAARRRQLSARAALVVFVVLVVAAFPLLVFRLGTFQWFLRDDFAFLAERSLRAKDLFAPWDGHWSTLPIIVYRVLWKTVGFNSYKPYQACVVALHLTAVVLLRVVMRRAGVGPWLATAAAGALILFGPGAQDIVWAFQIGFTGSLVFGLTQLLLCDHDGGFDRRDVLGILAGVVALMCSGVGLVMAFVVGITTFLTRGWKIAAAVVGPLAALYGVYWLVERPKATSVFGYPTVAVVLRWVRSAEIGAFRGLGHYAVVAWLLLAVLVVGLALAISSGRLAAVRGRLAAPLALLAGGLAFAVLTAIARWLSGENGARAGRFVYLSAALLLPALAVAAQAIARRWRLATPVLVVLFLLAVPANATSFGDPPFGKPYFVSEKRILTTITRMPFAAHVPGDVRPIPDNYISSRLDIAFLLHAAKTGRLPVSKGPIPRAEFDEYRVRLGLDQRTVSGLPSGCTSHPQGVDVEPDKGSTLRFLTPMSVVLLNGSTRSNPVVFDPANGQQLLVTLSGMHLRLRPFFPAKGVVLCDR
jgi:hypothetical protein